MQVPCRYFVGMGLAWSWAMITALFVETNGIYFNRPDIDPWDIKRNAMFFKGPGPIIAHPPCARWCRLAGLVEARWGHKRGDDGGTFKFALEQVRKYGGVLEHPAYSDAWKAFGLPRPNRKGGWTPSVCGGYTCHVEQGRYGHVAKKATWLYVFNTILPSLRWGSDPDTKSKFLVSWCGNHVSSREKRPRVGKARAAATPPDFLAVLLQLANSV